MRIQIVAFLLVFGLAQATTISFGQRVTLRYANSSLEAILKAMEKQSAHSFFYKKEDVQAVKPMSVDIRNMPLQQALDVVLNKSGFTYDFFDKTIVLKKKTSTIDGVKIAETGGFGAKTQAVAIQQFIRGTVLDDRGAPVVGASVRLKSDPRKAVSTQQGGAFTLPITAEGETLVVSFLGFIPAEIVAKVQDQPLLVRLKKQDLAVEEVVITGMMNRKKESFTGATASFTGEELKMVNNQNVVASLRALDPSFLLIENNNMGSNPNMLPTIELRGQTSIATGNLRDEFSADPNQPLFILDGFETDLRTIMDLDMNVVQSATILKDAASTALYGSRASNGVVVIETIKPKAGKVLLSYTSDLRLEAPDLSSYNMMNASEKLEFERLSGRYRSRNDIVEQQLILDNLYNDRLKNVLRGVDTYWLDKPIQKGFSQRHSVSARGGEGAVIFDIGANYKSTRGSMIGSERADWGSNFNLNYRAGKLNIANRAYVMGYTADASPYGSFATWVNTNPYYEPLVADEKYLAYSESINQGFFLALNNPFYNANLQSFDRTKNYVVNNNLQLTYDISRALRFTASGQISMGNTNANTFVSPLDTQFDGVENARKGQLTHRETGLFSYTANAMFTYAKVFEQKHSITANLRGEINESNGSANGYVAVGFPSASNGNPSFAFGYETNSKPAAATRIARRNSMVASVNYSYDQRYNVDVNYNMDGSTSFGSNNLYSPYYSVGLGWNMHKESFAKYLPWINLLRLRGNVGVTGNQSFGNVSQSVFNYSLDVNRFGQGITLGALGAPDLEWQRTRQTSIGMDATLFQNKLGLQLNAYDKLTDPLVIAVTLPSSTGLSNYPFNAGTLDVRGMEATINFSPIYRPADQVVLTFGLTGSMLKQRYDNFDNSLKALNQEMRESNSLVRFRDGFSPRDIWAVRSLGIDPATGREVFLAADGQQTFNYNADDIVAVGNAQPLAEGIFRTSLAYKGFTANLMFRYKWKADYLNTALYNKVENISLSNVENNQDRRALYDRWQNVGDESSFKGISITSTTPISSRFIQRENSFSGESINLGYEFRGKNWLDNAHLSNLRISTFMNDIFYSSTVRRERGIDYPFTRSVSLSINATFK